MRFAARSTCIRTLRLGFGGMLVLMVLCAAIQARAQSLKQTLRQHVREGIERSEQKARAQPKRKSKSKANAQPKPASKPASRAPAPASVSAHIGASTSEASSPSPNLAAGPRLPVRVFGDDFKVDITLGAGYRGWYPQQYHVVDVAIASYFTWSIDVKAKLFKFLSLRRGYYESNGVAAPRTKQAAVAAEIGSYVPKAAWLLGVVGVPISKVWEPQIRYESRAFDTRALPRRPVCVVPRNTPEDAQGCPGSMSSAPLKVISSFETLVAGVRYDHSKTGSVVVEQTGSKIPPLFFGVGLMQYRKPYQLTIDGDTLDDYLFNARFRGAGLALGADLGGGLDRFFGRIDVQLGLGEVSLTDSITLNELVPGGKLVGYVQGTAELGYRLPLIRAAPTLILVPEVKAGGASFFLVDTASDQTQQGKTTSPSVNWDFLWSVYLALLVPF